MLLSLCSGAQSPPVKVLSIGDTMPDITITNVYNYPSSTIHFSDLKGKLVILDFWATWCTGCKQEMPWYVEFADNYKKDGLAVLGVAMDDEGWRIVKPFLAEKMKLNYPVVVGDAAIAKQFGGVRSLPLTLLIDRGGLIAYSHAGVVDKEKFEDKIQELLARAR